MAMSVIRHRQSDRAAELREIERVGRDARGGFGQPIGLDQGVAGDGLPSFRDSALDGHAAADRELQRLEIEMREVADCAAAR